MRDKPLSVEEKAMLFDFIFSKYGYLAFEHLEGLIDRKESYGEYIGDDKRKKIEELFQRLKKIELES